MLIRNPKKAGLLVQAIILILFLSKIGLAQKVSLNDLRTPPSPAFVLLGVEPSSIERPNTPKAFAASLLSAVNQSDFLPKNYALEIAPYWLYSHPNLTFDDYYKAGLIGTVLQTGSLSLATSIAPNSIDSLPDTARLGFGLRTILINGKANSDLSASVANLHTIQENCTAPL
ncbi:MAG TPA: hypothetical protein VNL73_05145 [Verrucomicrobiae bacterium]|nr:hypothetical protein [Verrucomicrobiae bacterium]